MVIAPVVFFTIVHGIASVRDARSVGRVGIKALVYFEVVSTFALLIGLGVEDLPRGRGLQYRPQPDERRGHPGLHAARGA
jgi:aerobic C4-dicarboxylate transport protein